MQIIFLSVTKCLCLAQYVKKILVRHKKCGPIKNILGPVEGQGMSHESFENLEFYEKMVQIPWISS